MNQGEYWQQRIKDKAYDDEFAHHDEQTRRNFEMQETAFRLALESLDKSKVNSILEIGCGIGRMTKIISETFPIARIFATDISQEQIEKAERLNPLENVVYSQENFMTAGFTRADLVIASEVFLHFPLKEIGVVVRAAQWLSLHYLVHVDPLFPKKITYWRDRLRKATDWAHDYPRLYDHSMIKKLAMIPIINEKQHIFIVERK